MGIPLSLFSSHIRRGSSPYVKKMELGLSPCCWPDTYQNNIKKNKPNPSTINTKPSIYSTNSLSIYNTITTIRLKPLDNDTKPNIAINIATLCFSGLYYHIHTPPPFPCYFSIVYFSHGKSDQVKKYMAKVDGRAQKSRDRPRWSFWDPLTAILDFWG